MSEAHTQSRGTVYDQVCRVLKTTKQADETAEEFKHRAAREFNTFSEEEFAELPDSIQMWSSETSKVVASNLDRQRARALPGLPGLDATLQRFDITKPLPKKQPGRKRVPGEDAITRIMTVMATVGDPANVKIEELRELVNDRYHVIYSDSALNQAAKAFNTARQVLGHNQRQAAE